MATTKNLTVADLAKTLKMKPRAVRRHLRALPGNVVGSQDQRWAFTPAVAKKVVAAIKHTN